MANWSIMGWIVFIHRLVSKEQLMVSIMFDYEPCAEVKVKRSSHTNIIIISVIW